MSSNEQRREAAKRKLERQLVRREEQERGRGHRLIIVAVVATVLIIGGGIWFATSRGSGSSTASSGTTTGTEAAATSAAAPKTPCSYTTAGKAAKAVTKPANLSPLNLGSVASTISLNGQNVDVTLDRAAAPCTVNSFLSLASQKFFDNSPCWRLTGNSALNILQCGDPTGVGNGGPGYTVADELTKTKTYPKGTLAMANSGAGTGGSQFFVVYKDSTLTPSYTVFGKVSDSGIAVIDGIAAKGIKGNSQDGHPVATAVIDSVSVPSGALTGTGKYATTASVPAGAPGAVPPGAAATAVAPSSK